MNWNRETKTQVVSYIFILPSFLFLFVFLIFPLAHSFYLSLTRYNFVFSAHPEFIGMTNYLDLISDDHFVVSFKNTLYYTLFYFPIFFFFPLGVAILLRKGVKGTTIFRSGILLPLVIPASLAAVVFLWILDNEWGLLNYLLREILSMPFFFFFWIMDTKVIIGNI